MEGDMDYQSLSRRELQALCKKNKIPANMTNVAMADALQSLEHVEGLEEIMKPAESEIEQSPEKMGDGSMSVNVPRSVCRTSTRRKSVKEEPESVQPMTRTRGGAKSRIAGDVPPTPTVASSHQKASAAMTSARRKTVNLAYSTRRSVRLAEKQMSGLSLNEKGKIQPITIADFSKEMSESVDDIQENKSLSGFVKQEISQDVEYEVSSAMSCEKEMVVEVTIKEEIVGMDLESKQALVCELINESAVSEKIENMLESNLENDIKLEENSDCDAEKSNANLESKNDDELSLGLNESSFVENSECFIEPEEPKTNFSDLSVYHVSNENAENAQITQESDFDFVIQSQSDTNISDKNDKDEFFKEENEKVTEEIPFSAMETVENAPSAKKTIPIVPKVSNDELKGKIPFSNWAVDPLVGHIPRPPQITLRKSTNVPNLNAFEGNNKENVDNNGVKMEMMKENVKKNKDNASKSLDNLSLRQLTKMLKGKLNITNSINDNETQKTTDQSEEMTGKVAARLALMPLPENQA